MGNERKIHLNKVKNINLFNDNNVYHNSDEIFNTLAEHYDTKRYAVELCNNILYKDIMKLFIHSHNGYYDYPSSEFTNCNIMSTNDSSENLPEKLLQFDVINFENNEYVADFLKSVKKNKNTIKLYKEL